VVFVCVDPKTVFTASCIRSSTPFAASGVSAAYHTTTCCLAVLPASRPTVQPVDVKRFALVLPTVSSVTAQPEQTDLATLTTSVQTEHGVGQPCSTATYRYYYWSAGQLGLQAPRHRWDQGGQPHAEVVEQAR
jgi:hypothetical protein